MKKRLLPILVSLMAMLVMVPLITGTAYAANKYVDCENGLKCVVDTNTGTAEVCGRADNNTSDTITIAPFTLTYDGKTYDAKQSAVGF